MSTAITGHYPTRTGRIVFIVKKGRLQKKLYEYEMKGMKTLLKQYRNRVSHIKWNGKPGIYVIAEILDHRTDQRGIQHFLVSWAGAWNDPIWRSEVTLTDFETEPTEYLSRMGTEKSERQRQGEKRRRH